MDINKCLDVAIGDAETILDPQGHGFDKIDIDVATDLAEKLINMDEWLRAGGFLPERWQGDGATTLIRHIKGDVNDYKNITWQHARHPFYVEVWWRRNDMARPLIEANLYEGKRSPDEARMMATLLRAAAAEADAWVKKAEGGLFWSASLKER